jgi:predicted acetyltransferase
VKIELIEAQRADKSVLQQLMELYLYDFSDIDASDVNEHGLFEYRRLDSYWTESGRYPFLFRVDGHWAGFALVCWFSYFPDNALPTQAIAEFFVMRKYRRRGVGTRMAGELFARFPGRWEVAEMRQNLDAQAFWRRVIGEFTDGRFEEHDLDNEHWRGSVQVFASH